MRIITLAAIAALSLTVAACNKPAGEKAAEATGRDIEKVANLRAAIANHIDLFRLASQQDIDGRGKIGWDVDGASKVIRSSQGQNAECCLTKIRCQAIEHLVDRAVSPSRHHHVIASLHSFLGEPPGVTRLLCVSQCEPRQSLQLLGQLLQEWLTINTAINRIL